MFFHEQIMLVAWAFLHLIIWSPKCGYGFNQFPVQIKSGSNWVFWAFRAPSFMYLPTLRADVFRLPPSFSTKYTFHIF